ncbi:MAG: calcium/sodium antiporter [Flammeovirgaceae bacterium]
MPIWLSIIIILLAFYIMTVLIESRFIQSLDNISNYLKLPESVAGATLLAFGTSAPEISTALVALFLDGASPATGIGAIVGSAIFQILVVIGFTAYVKTTTLDWKPVVRDTLFYALCVGLLIYCLHDQQLTVTEGWLLVGCYIAYLLLLAWWTKNVKENPKKVVVTEEEIAKIAAVQQPDRSKLKAFFKLLTFPVDKVLSWIPNAQERPKWTLPVFILCLFIIGYSCYWLVLAAEAFAGHVGISEAVIALTVLAGGSSIPEMISSGVVARQGRGDMAIANAIGSNIFDILISLGLPVLIYTSLKGNLSETGGTDLSSSVSLLFGSLILVFLILLINKFKINRAIGITLIVIYVIYVWAAYTGYIDRLWMF